MACRLPRLLLLCMSSPGLAAAAPRPTLAACWASRGLACWRQRPTRWRISSSWWRQSGGERCSAALSVLCLCMSALCAGACWRAHGEAAATPRFAVAMPATGACCSTASWAAQSQAAAAPPAATPPPRTTAPRTRTAACRCWPRKTLAPAAPAAAAACAGSRACVSCHRLSRRGLRASARWRP